MLIQCQLSLVARSVYACVLHGGVSGWRTKLLAPSLEAGCLERAKNNEEGGRTKTKNKAAWPRLRG